MQTSLTTWEEEEVYGGRGIGHRRSNSRVSYYLYINYYKSCIYTRINSVHLFERLKQKRLREKEKLLYKSYKNFYFI